MGNIDVVLDSSEYYDYQLGSIENDFDVEILDFTNIIDYSSKIIDSNCLIDFQTPWVLPIGEPYNVNTCDFNIRNRTENGWTLNFIINKESKPWSEGGTFYYLGFTNEYDEKNYLDNNLSFSFTDDGRIKWESIRYSGFCDSVSGYTFVPYITTGETSILCSGATLNDFLITITYERYRNYQNCDLLNLGGENDLITGVTSTNPLDVITGGTEQFESYQILNEKWFNEKKYRLGVLKIYLNSIPIYSVRDWEEIIPTQRTSDNNLVQIWGGGTLGSGNIHSNDTNFNIKKIQYYEEPLKYLNIKHLFFSEISKEYETNNCNTPCGVSDITGNLLTTNDGLYIVTSNNEYLILNI